LGANVGEIYFLRFFGCVLKDSKKKFAKFLGDEIDKKNTVFPNQRPARLPDLLVKKKKEKRSFCGGKHPGIPGVWH